MNFNKLLPAVSVAAVVAFAASAAVATPVVGNPINGPAILNINPGAGNFDVTIGSHAGAESYAGNGTWSGTASACTAIGNPAGCGTNELVDILNSHWVGNDNTANPGPGGAGANPFTTGGYWVSFAETGVDGVDNDDADIPDGASDYNDAVNEIPNGTYTYTFTFDTTTFAHMGLWIYADDTAEVFIAGSGIGDGTLGDKIQISLDPSLVPDEHCGQGGFEGIGCETGEQAFIEMFWLNPNSTYTIEISTLQVADRAFGLMFAGGLVNVPEPGTLALLGLGVLGLGVARRRRKAA